MLKIISVLMLCFMSATAVATERTIDKAPTHRFVIKNDLNKKVKIGDHTIVLTRVDSRAKRIHFNAKPRYRKLKVEAFDREGKKMKLLKKGENLSTSLTSNHKYMYKTMPMYIEIK